LHLIGQERRGTAGYETAQHLDGAMHCLWAGQEPNQSNRGGCAWNGREDGTEGDTGRSEPHAVAAQGMRQSGEDIEPAVVGNIPGTIGIAGGIRPSSWGASLFRGLGAAEGIHADKSLMLWRIRTPARDQSTPAEEAKTCNPS
jgi:hypothetical protein